MKNLFLPVLVLLLFTSCDKRIGQCEKTAESFFAAIMEGDEEAMLKESFSIPFTLFPTYGLT